jgi:pimeloyl-ACP methyl ester carboxylesterase
MATSNPNPTVAEPKQDSADLSSRDVRKRHRLRHIVWVVVRSLAGLVILILVLLTIAATVFDLVTAGVRPVPPLGPHQHTAATGDIVTRYTQWGTRGPAVVLVPGFAETSFMWSRVGPALGKSYRVYAYDIRGVGYSTHRPPYTLASDAQQLLQFAKALHLDAAHHSLPVLVGHSSGAAIVADAARISPGSSAGVVMLDGDGTPYGAGPGFVHRLIVDPFFTAALRLAIHNPGLILDRIWSRLCGPRCPPLTGQELNGWVRPFEVAGAEGSMKSIVQAPLIGLTVPQLSTIRVPAVVMRGHDDPSLTADGARAIYRWLQAKELITVPDSSHLPMVSNPKTFVLDLSMAIKNLRATRTIR